MVITSANTGKTITTDYAIQSGQTATEQTAYFVLEHQPDSCSAYPSNGVATFTNISVAVDGQLVPAPAWQALDERPACSSKTTIVDPQTIKITWDPDAEAREPSRKWTAAPRPVEA